MSAYGFSSLAPIAVRYGLELLGLPCAIVRTSMDALEASRSSTIRVLLWEDLSAFSAIDYAHVESFSHVFFASRPQLESAGIRVIDIVTSAPSVLIRNLAPHLSDEHESLDPDVVAYLHNVPVAPETLFSREVKKTPGKKKKDTSPVFVAGSSLRQGVKEILDMCGHNNEVATYRQLLSFLLFLNSPFHFDLPDVSIKSFQQAFSCPCWEEAHAYCLGRLRQSIQEMTLGRPVVVEGFSFEEHTESALLLLAEWLHSKYAPYALYGYYKVLHGVPEGRALYESNCDPSSLSLLSRNVDFIRHDLLASVPFYRRNT